VEMRKAAEACLVEMIRVFDLDPVCPYHTDSYVILYENMKDNRLKYYYY
jgi:hypothetical protein